MAKIFATDRDGTKYEVTGRDRASLMELLRQAGLSIEALCSGSCQCATCHVFVEEPWLSMLRPQTDFELAALEGEGSEIKENSRLACQISWSDDL
ncbi:MAG: ferredoxin, partial [Gammaproteobacteria bacterium]